MSITPSQIATAFELVGRDAPLATLAETLAAYREARAAEPAPFMADPTNAVLKRVRATWAVYYAAIACGMPKDNVYGAVGWAEARLAERVAA